MDSFPYPSYNWTPRQASPPPPPPRITLAGSLDPTTGIFYRTPEHPRLRTAQACEKCRTRKAKCSGDHPSCQRCLSRGLICEYAKEGRVRGPNKVKRDQSVAASSSMDGGLSRRRRTTMSGLEPLSTHVPLPLALPRLDTSFPGPMNVSTRLGGGNSGSNKRFSLPSSLDTSTLDRYYSPSVYNNDQYGSEPPDSATASSYSESRRGSFDPVFGIEPMPKDLSFSSHSSQETAYNEPVQGAFAGQAYGYTASEESLHPLSGHRPGSSRSSSTSSSSGRGSYEGADSGPNSAVSGSFPLFSAYPSGSPYSTQASSNSSNFSGHQSPHASPPHLSPATSVATLQNHRYWTNSDSFMRHSYEIPTARHFSDSDDRVPRGSLRGWTESHSNQRQYEREMMAAAMTGGRPHQHIPTSDTRGGRPSPLSLPATSNSGMYPDSPSPDSMSRTMTEIAMPIPVQISLGMSVDSMDETDAGGVPMTRTISADALITSSSEPTSSPTRRGRAATVSGASMAY